MPERFYVSYLGEYYDDALTLEAAIKNRTKSAEAASLLSSKLQERKERRHEMIQYLADKRGISFREMLIKLLSGDYQPLTAEEIKTLGQLEGDASS